MTTETPPCPHPSQRAPICTHMHALPDLTFDAVKARCFLARDRHHLLGIIEANFGIRMTVVQTESASSRMQYEP